MKVTINGVEYVPAPKDKDWRFDPPYQVMWVKDKSEEKWAKEKEAFARGENIQWRARGAFWWNDTREPLWDDSLEWRIAPKKAPKKKWIWARMQATPPKWTFYGWAFSPEYLTEDEAKEFGWIHKLEFTEIEE